MGARPWDQLRRLAPGARRALTETQACRALDFPVVSGNVSLYNETAGSAILPTPVIGGLGLIDDLSVIRRELTEGALHGSGRIEQALAGEERRYTARFRALLEEIQGEERVSLAALSVAVQEIRSLASKLRS